MSKTCLLIPVYDHEEALGKLLEGLRPHGLPCLLVDDGSNPDSAKVLDALADKERSWVRLFRHAVNQGKGGAVMTGVKEANALGYTHVLQIDADGQHSPDDVPKFLAASAVDPQVLVCGEPIFDESAPKARLWGRVLTNVWVWINTLSFAVKDGLCGFRLYPVGPLINLFSRVQLGTRMDFDPELLVRLSWDGLRFVNLPVKVRYPLDGRSHFRMGPDNWLISKMHARMFFGMLLRFPLLLWRRAVPKKSQPPRNWSSMQEVGSSFGLRFLFRVYRIFGRLPFRLTLYPVLAWFFVAKTVPRNASLEFLGRALRRPATWKDGLRHFLSFAEALLDKVIAWNGGFRLTDVEFRGREHLAALLEKGTGCILVGSHLGNIEICRVLSRWRPGMELHVLVHTRHSQNWNGVMQRLDPASQVNLHQVSELDAGLGAWMAERVARGAVLVIAGDRVPLSGDRVSEANFFGEKAPFPEGPYLLAHALGCPVLFFFCLRDGQGFIADFEPFEDSIRLPRGPQRKEALRALVSRYASRLEAHAVQHPFQWFNFFPFWQNKNAKE